MSRAASAGFILLFRRSYTVVAADNAKVKGQEVASTIKNVVVDSDIIDMSKIAKGLRKEVSWMRDPKTGNWLPETHFDEVDVAELRAKIFSNKP